MSTNDTMSQDPAPTAAMVSRSSSESPGSQPPNVSTSIILDDTTTSSFIADIARFFSGGKGAPVTIHDVFREMEQLRLALKAASEQSCKDREYAEKSPKTDDTGKSTLPDQEEQFRSPLSLESSFSQRPPSPRRRHQFQTLGDPRERLRYTKEVFISIFLNPFPEWLKENMTSFVSNVPGSQSNPFFHLKVHGIDVAIQQTGDKWGFSNSNVAKIREWVERDWPEEPTNETIFTYWYPPRAKLDPNDGESPVNFLCNEVSVPASSPVGNIWWMADLGYHPESNWPAGIGHGHRLKILTLREIACLGHCFFSSEPGRKDMGTYNQKLERRLFIQFIFAFSHPLAKRTLREVGKDCYVWQFHLRHFAPVGQAWTLDPLNKEGLVVQRQYARIRRTANDGHGEQNFEERALSVSLQTFKAKREFKIVVLGDSGAKRAGRQPKMNSEVSEKVAGPTNFLMVMIQLMEIWHRGWNDTLDVIDKMIGFHMDYTLDDRRLDGFMFDNSSSMNLSRQYFTVLQLLRIAIEWVEKDLSEWEKAWPSYDRDVGSLLRDSPLETTISLESWSKQRDKVTQSMRTQTLQLKTRIEKKSEEVASLRDALLNATSLREAVKGMALNRAIYVFTAVTIIYTPLGFIAALWALPILNTTPSGDNVHPSKSAFIATFVTIPISTYVFCGWMAWYFTSTRSWKSLTAQVVKIWQGFESALQKWLARGASNTETLGTGFDAKNIILAGAKTDDPGATLLVDITGGEGHDVEAFSKAYHDAPGKLVLQDLPHVIAVIKQLDDRIIRQEHDMFTEQPITVARAYYMRNIYHDWPDEQCVETMKHIAEAMTRGYSKLLIFEWILPTKGVPLYPALLDVNMISILNGRLRTEKGWKELLNAAGLKIVEIHRISPQEKGLIEAELV